MNKQYLLREYFAMCDGGFCPDLLTLQEKKEISNGAMYLTGKLQEGDIRNGNGRVYPARVLEREIKNYQRLIQERRAVGELDHPDRSVINLQNASHLITEIWMDGKTVMGKIKVLNTSAGNTLKALVNDGVQLGISSRGLGSVKESSGQVMVEDDFQLICFDIVSDPSTPGAFMNLSENRVPVKEIFDKNYRINCLLNSILG